MSEEPNKGVYLLELELHNVKCFTGPEKIDFRGADGNWAQWSVIIGENGVGKTTVLRAIAGLCPEVNNLGQEFVHMVFEKSDLYMAIQRNKEGHIYMKAWTEGFPTSETAPWTNSFKWSQSGSEYGTNTYLAMGLACIGYGASRKMGSTDQSSNRLGDTSATLFDDEALLANAEELIIRIDYQAEKDKTNTAKRQRKRIQEILLNILPEVRDLKIVHRESDFGSEVHFQTPDGWVRLQDMSLGYKTLISWVVDLASKMFIIYKSEEKPLEQPVIVLVDEIDLHMHPKWQRKIMDYLGDIFKRAQFIVTAHSPLIVQAAQDANLILLKRVGDHVEVENDPIHVKNWRIDQILASDLFGGVSAHSEETEELLEKRKSILSKSTLTPKDQKDLEKLEKEIGTIPSGQSQEEIQMMDIIRKAAEQLK
jgi:predicted ATP-binding protein involved in virulence